MVLSTDFGYLVQIPGINITFTKIVGSYTRTELLDPGSRIVRDHILVGDVNSRPYRYHHQCSHTQRQQLANSATYVIISI